MYAGEEKTETCFKDHIAFQCKIMVDHPVDRDAGVLQPPCQLLGVEDVGKLRLRVGLVLVVVLLPVQVLPVHGAHFVGHARDDDDPRAESRGGRLLEERREQLREEEVAEVVGAELHIEAVLGLPLGAGHHAGVVDLG